MKVEVAVLGFLSLTVLNMVSVHGKQQRTGLQTVKQSQGAV